LEQADTTPHARDNTSSTSPTPVDTLHTTRVMCNPYLYIVEAAANIAKQHDALVPDSMHEQSRNIITTTHKIEDLEAQISGMRKNIDQLNLTLSANQRYTSSSLSTLVS
jgi:hypothetical protein